MVRDKTLPDDTVTPLRKPRPCPECGKPSLRSVWPFCSPRCADVDLGRWFSGGYRIPGPPATIPTGEDEDAGSQDA